MSEFFTADQLKKLANMASFGSDYLHVETVPSGVLALDYAIGSGLPRARITEISGLGRAGKTTTALIASAEAVARGEYVAYIDLEQSLDQDWGQVLGIPSEEIAPNLDTDLEQYHFHVYRPSTLDDALEIIRSILKTDQYGLIVLDSIAGGPTIAQAEASVTDVMVGDIARVMNRFKRQVAPEMAGKKAALLFLNQLYSVIGGVLNSAKPYGGTKVPYGGEAMTYLCSLRLVLYDAKPIKTSEGVTGKLINGEIWKSKIGRDHLRFEYTIGYIPEFYVDGISDLMDTAALVGTLSRKGAYWYSPDGERLAGSKDEMWKTLRDNPDLANTIIESTRTALQNMKGKRHGSDPSPDTE